MRGKITRGVLAVLAVAACGIAVASASAAEPTVYECGKAEKTKTKPPHYTGGYNDKLCSEVNIKHEGAYEFQEWNLTAKKGKAKVFKGKTGGANLEVQGQGGVACTSNGDVGQFTGPKTVGKIVVTFKGCELNHHQCENPKKLGEKLTPGVIVTSPLRGEVGYVEGGKAKHEVGVQLTTEVGAYEAEFDCGELELRVSGSVIGLVTSSENVFTKEATLLFQESEGRQLIKKLEGGPEVHLSAEVRGGKLGEFSPPKESGESDEVTNKGELLELKA